MAEFGYPAFQLRCQDVEVPAVARVVKLVCPALDEVAGEFRRWADDLVIFEEDDVLQENAADLRVIPGAERIKGADQGA